MAMGKDKNTLYERLTTWLDDVKKHELTNIIEVVEQAKAYFVAAESIPEEKVAQFVDNFKQDLHEFYQHNQSQFDNSLYVALLKERFWQKMADITDRSQVEWSELTEDFQHQGSYQVGDYIGFGVLICEHCDHAHEIFHLSEVAPCTECGGTEFKRRPFSP